MFFTGKARQTISSTEQERLEAAGVYLHEDQRKGTWADSEVERLLRAILKYCKQQGSYSGHEVYVLTISDLIDPDQLVIDLYRDRINF